ncbi:hypothetical protein [Epibacterium ulvae]|uniref:hypothetical protein n=1 Tax=Epibacterium ulvae TaxID=1156985 RepID=UPI00248FE06D|nr:hypothetical protein [Epibacterium ulvae]
MDVLLSPFVTIVKGWKEWGTVLLIWVALTLVFFTTGCGAGFGAMKRPERRSTAGWVRTVCSRATSASLAVFWISWTTGFQHLK